MWNNKIFVLIIVLIHLSQILAGRQNKFQSRWSRIINGYPCATSKFPFFVMVLTGTICGGSLLTPDWVLTAAHCLPPKLVEGATYTVHSAFDISPQVRNVKEVHNHPNFNGKDFVDVNDLRYDIGLILVAEPFRQTAVVTLPAPGFTKQCKQVMVLGIGATYSMEKPPSAAQQQQQLQRPLKCVNVSIIDSKVCKEDYLRIKKEVRFDDTIVCTHEQGKGTCRGDSGGPLLCDNVVIGIVSFGPVECEKRPSAATCTRVESYRDFINQFVKFTGNIKHARLNSTSVGASKTSGKSSAQVGVFNWSLVLLALFSWFIALC